MTQSRITGKRVSVRGLGVIYLHEIMLSAWIDEGRPSLKVGDTTLEPDFGARLSEY